jgi:hypothetical protein
VDQPASPQVNAPILFSCGTAFAARAALVDADTINRELSVIKATLAW